MGGADQFIARIRDKETRALQRMFAGVHDPFEFGAKTRPLKVRSG
jgi:hypothetical protein